MTLSQIQELERRIQSRCPVKTVPARNQMKRIVGESAYAKVRLICVGCKQPFWIRKVSLKKDRGKYCTRACANRFTGKRRGII